MCLFVAVFDSGFHEGAPETTDFKGPAKIYSESESERANITIGPRITENFPHILCGGGEDISSMCDMLRSPRTQCNAPKNAITPWKMGRWTISILLEGKKRHDKDFYLQIHHLDFAILLLCVSHSFFSAHFSFLCRSIRRRKQFIESHKRYTSTQYTYAYAVEKGSTWKHKYNQKCLLCSNCWRKIYIFICVAIFFMFILVPIPLFAFL